MLNSLELSLFAHIVFYKPALLIYNVQKLFDLELFMTANELRKHVLDLDTGEAKYFLLLFCDVLDRENLSDNDPLIMQANAVVNGISKVFQAKTKQEMREAITTLYLSYESLYQTSQVGNYSKKIQRSVIHLLGYISGLVSGILHFFVIPFVAIHYNWGTRNQTWKDVLRYFIIGFGSGFNIGMRWTEDFENRKDRQMFYVINGVMSSIKGLEIINEFKEDQTPESNAFKAKRDGILMKLFGNDEERKNRFLTEKQTYELISINAKFGTINLQGLIGHHLTLVFRAIDSGAPIIIELDGPKEEDPAEDVTDPLTSQYSILTPAQTEKRTCTGEQLIQMMVLDRLLQQHMPWGTYKPGDNDCHTHIDKVLASVGQPLSTLTRHSSSEEAHWLSKYIGEALQKYSVFPHKPTYCETAPKKTVDNEEPHRGPDASAAAG